MIDFDQTVIESTATHRERLSAAFVYGAQTDRRRVNSNIKRFVGSVILAAVMCAGCLGTGFVLNLLQTQKEAKAVAAFRQAQAANPLQPGGDLAADEASGFLRDQRTGDLIDPRTGFIVDPATGLASDPDGRTIDPKTGWFVDAETGLYTDPATGITIDPVTLRVVEQGQGE